MAKRALTTALFLIAAFFMLCACKQEQGASSTRPAKYIKPPADTSGPQLLAYDLARTGVVPGQQIPKKFRVPRDSSLQNYAEPGQTRYYCANASFSVDANDLIQSMSIWVPEVNRKSESSSTIKFKDQDGKEIFGLSEDEIIARYGTPSKKYVESGIDPPTLNLEYIFQKDSKTYYFLALNFVMEGEKVKPLDSITAYILDMKNAEDLRKKKVTFYDWPSKL